MRFRYFLPLALSAGALAGLVSARANLLGSPFSAGGGPSPTSIAFQNFAELGETSGSASYSAPYTNVTNVNTALLVGYNENGGLAPLTFTFNSVSCTHIGDASPSGTAVIHMYFCAVGSLAPGAHTIAITTSVPNTEQDVCVWEYSGVAQTTATENVTTANAGTSTASVTFTTTTDSDWGVGIANNTTAGDTGAGAGYTARGSNQSCGVTSIGIVRLVDKNAPITPPASTTPSVTYSGGVVWGFVGFGLKHG